VEYVLYGCMEIVLGWGHRYMMVKGHVVMPSRASCLVGQEIVFVVCEGPKLLKGQCPILASAEEKPTVVVVAVQGARSTCKF